MASPHFSPHSAFCALFAGLLLASSAAAQDRIAESVRLRDAGKWPESLQALRDEIASPRRTNDPDAHAVNVRQLLMYRQGEYAAFFGFDEKMDEEVRRLYDEGKRIARGRRNHESILDNGMTYYYSRTYRNGLGLPYLRRELAYWLESRNAFRGILGYHAMSNAYLDIGEATLGRYYIAKTLAAAKEHFVLGQKPSDINEWLQYWMVLNGFMSAAAQRGDLAEMEQLWALREPIAGRYWNLNALSYSEAAELFALAGDAKRAAELAQKADALWSQEQTRFNENIRRQTELALVCKKGSTALYSGDAKAALAYFARCDELFKATGTKDADVSQALRAQAHERNGELEAAARLYQVAIDGWERARGSYSVAERANFFRSVARKPYWGQIRVAARLAAAGDEGRFFHALQVSEMVRARQLGELLDPEAGKRVSAPALAQLQKRLRADDVVLAYTVTDGDIVLLAMSAATARAYLIPYEAKEFRQLATSIAADLARPESAMAALDAKLARFGRLLVAPAAQELQGKKRITVLTDGLMNLVPFELLSYAADGFRPLYRDYVVVNSPSLLFIEHAERARRGGKASNLLAVADPAYPKNPDLKLSQEESSAIVSRGSRYLSYFTALPETRTEVQAIGGMFAGEKVELLVGERALESAIKKADLSGYQHLHFATHGVIGNEVPGLQEPALVLGNEPGEDGFLTMGEVSKLKLDAEITVLSACNTGSGEFVEGEGVMGMSRAFLGAGSRSVVVSLWPVASMATERLMVAFYRHLRSGKEAAAALRDAKLELLEQAQKSNPVESHPFFWAPFILLGG